MNTLKINHKAVVVALAVVCLVMQASSTPSRTSASTPAVSVVQNAKLDFTLVNETGYPIKALYIATPGVQDFTDDMEILRGTTLQTGFETEITFAPRTRGAKWDIMVDWEDGDASVYWRGVNLTQIEKMTLLYNAETGVTSARYN